MGDQGRVVRRIAYVLALVLLAVCAGASVAIASSKDPCDAIDARGAESFSGDRLVARLVEALTPEARRKFAAGADARLIQMRCGRTLAEALSLAKGLGLSLRTSSVDGGSPQVAAGGTFRVRAVIGQPDAGMIRATPFTLRGGFLGRPPRIVIFSDGFETGDCSSWSTNHCQP